MTTADPIGLMLELAARIRAEWPYASRGALARAEGERDQALLDGRAKDAEIRGLHGRLLEAREKLYREIERRTSFRVPRTQMSTFEQRPTTAGPARKTLSVAIEATRINIELPVAPPVAMSRSEFRNELNHTIEFVIQALREKLTDDIIREVSKSVFPLGTTSARPEKVHA